MRLTCPNCDAQYEVPAEVVPTTGRDVQCSNCGKTWFQYHPDHEPEVADAAAAELSPTAPAPDDEVSSGPPAGVVAKRRQLDPGVADILRQEAEIEYEARRRRQAQTLESQPDLGLEAARRPAPPPPPPAPAPVRESQDERRATEAQERMARMRGETQVAAEEAAADAAMSSRRELLPDVDEINSTLRSEAKPHAVPAQAREEVGAGGEPKSKRGFQRGFIMMLFVFAVLAWVYVFGDTIIRTIPGSEGVVTAYVEWIDNMRLTLDTRLKSMLGNLDTIANGTNN